MPARTFQPPLLNSSRLFLPLHNLCRKPHLNLPQHPCVCGRQSHIIAPAFSPALHMACGQPGKPTLNRAETSASPHSSLPRITISKPRTTLNRASPLNFAAISTLPRTTSTTTVLISSFTLFLRSLSRTPTTPLALNPSLCPRTPQSTPGNSQPGTLAQSAPQHLE